MFVCLFVSQTQTKEFCEAFKDNRFRVDFTFFAGYKLEQTSSKWYSRSLFVIGTDYWVISRSSYNYAFRLNESLLSDVFGSHYSLAFTVYKNNDFPYYGFLRVRQILEFSFYNIFF